jgi:uncharacterized phage protein (TIGR01671 family)
MVAERKRGMRMQDRYLFKAKRTDNGEWVIGNRIDDGVTGQVFIHAVGNSVNESDKVGEEGCLQFVAFEVAPATICQCTGLKDKNGNLIWENDIVMTVYDGNEHIYQVVWDESELDFKATNGKENYESNFEYLPCCDEIEILGNCFDNPELLEEEE